MSSKTELTFLFEDFSLDIDERCLKFRDQPVSLTPKAFQTLVVLLRNHGKVVEKEYFLNEVWADTFVEESTLAQNILTLRKALARFSSDKEFIITVPRRGYQFVADVQELSSHDDEVIVLEKRTRTHLIARQREDELPTDSPGRSVLSLPGNGVGTYRAISFALLLVMLVGVGYVAFRTLAQPTFAESKFRKFRADPIVADADIRNASISQNGKYLALLQVKNGVQSLYLRQVESGNTLQIVPQITGKFIGAAFSPDDEHIYYSLYEGEGKSGIQSSTLYRVAVQGGASQQVLRHIDSPVAVSPDGSQLAFIRRYAERKESTLVVTDVEGRNERTLAVRPMDRAFSESGLSWSPDGKLLAAMVLERQNATTSAQIAAIDTTSGEQRILSKENWILGGQTLWLKDGSGILTVAYGAKSPSLDGELWIVSYPEGKSRLITNGINGDYGISWNEATNSVVAVESSKFACFLTAPVDNLFKNTHVLTTVSDETPLRFGADWTNDGRILYSTADGGNADIYTISEDGSERKQLTSDESAEILPNLSADGRYLVFISNRSGQLDVWRSDANGTNTVQLTTNGNVKHLIVSPQGDAVFYLVRNPDAMVDELWRVSIDGEDPTQLTASTTRSPRISPDGQTVASYIINPETNKMDLALLSARTGTVVKYLSTPETDDIPFIDWAKDGESLFVVLQRGKPQSLWKISLDGSKPFQLREWENDAIFRLAISRDGARVFYEVGNQLNTVVQFQSLDNVGS